MRTRNGSAKLTHGFSPREGSSVKVSLESGRGSSDEKEPGMRGAENQPRSALPDPQP